jgi:outer membrane receptor protein involved in Fe transport
MSAKGQKQPLHGAPAMPGLPPESGHGAAQLNIENIFNKGYWATADGNNNLSPGQPRTYRLKVTAKL